MSVRLVPVIEQGEACYRIGEDGHQYLVGMFFGAMSPTGRTTFYVSEEILLHFVRCGELMLGSHDGGRQAPLVVRALCEAQRVGWVRFEHMDAPAPWSRRSGLVWTQAIPDASVADVGEMIAAAIVLAHVVRV